MPLYKQIYDQYSDQEYAHFYIFIDVSGAWSSVLNFYNTHSAYWPATGWLWDPSRIAFDAYRAKVGLSTGIGQIYIVDLDGNIRYAHQSTVGSASVLTNVIDELL